MKKTAAPGPDSITARHLFNLDEDTIAQLVEHFNREYMGPGSHTTNLKKIRSQIYPEA